MIESFEKVNSSVNCFKNYGVCSELIACKEVKNSSIAPKYLVRRLLRQYGYPLYMQILATETVLHQAELIADELTGK